MQKVHVYNCWTLIRLMLPFCALFLLLSCGLFQASDIFAAIESKNIRNVKKVLNSKVDLHLRNKLGQTPLIFAAQHGSKAAVKALLKKGIDVNAVDFAGKTALDYAITLHRNDSVLCLVKHEAKVTSQENLESVQKLLKRRAYVLMGISLVPLAIVTYFFVPAAIHGILYPVVDPICFAAIAASGAIVAGVGVAMLIPGVHWYRRAKNIQLL